MSGENRKAIPPRPPAAVIGLGAVSAFGWTAGDLATGLRTAATTIGEPRWGAVGFQVGGHRTRLVSEVAPSSSAPEPLSSSAAWGTLSRADQFAVVAAQEALNHAFGEPSLSDTDRSRTGVFFGGSTAGMAESERWFKSQLGVASGPGRLRDLRSQQLNGPGDAVARELQVCGPVISFSSACASGALALGAALEAIRSGEVEVAIAGGSDSLCQMTYAGFNALRAVDPELSRPFRADRAGLNLGEGAGVLILVSESRAQAFQRQGGEVLAWLRGAGASCDAHHMTAPHPDGEGAIGAMEAALRDGELQRSAVGFVNAHGTGTPHNDSAEAAAIRTVVDFPGDSSEGVPVTSIKGAVGHLLGAAGAVEAVATVLALHDQSVQPTTSAGVEEGADPTFGVDLVLQQPRPIDPGLTSGLSNSFAFGGANASLLFSRTRSIPDEGLAEE